MYKCSKKYFFHIEKKDQKTLVENIEGNVSQRKI